MASQIKIITAKGIRLSLNFSIPPERAVGLGQFEPDIVPLFESLIPKSGIVLDVGAWIGYYALLAAQKTGERGRIIAIEPVPENIDAIIRNVRLNHLNNIEVVPCGVSHCEGISSFTPIASPTAHIIPFQKDNAIKIRIRKLDDILHDAGISHVDVMIMDVEGSESYAFQGLRAFLENRAIDNIICEVHPRFLKRHNCNIQEVYQLLTKNNYNIKILDLPVHSDWKIDSVFHIWARKT